MKDITRQDSVLNVVKQHVTLILCAYIGYNWARANQISKTLDNAVDLVSSLSMDGINLFTRIPRINRQKKVNKIKL